jgi:protein-histidine pros-kinase
MSVDNHAIPASIEAKFLDFLESVPDAMVLSNYEGRIVLVNSNVERMFGYKRDELVDKKVEVLISNRFRSAHMKHRASYYADPSIRPMGIAEVVWARRKDGAEFHVEINLSADAKIKLQCKADISHNRNIDEMSYR